jgi:biopolymer transport protein ExbD
MAINKRKIQEVNAGSMADISFLLLIFFLVATTMNTDTGINRNLPPIQEEEDPTPTKERNILKVFVNLNNELMVNMERTELPQLKQAVKDFVLNRANDPLLPEKTMTEIEGMGSFPVSEGIVSLQNDRGTSYGTYIAVQNEMVKAFNEIRNDVSMQYFGKVYAELSEAQQEGVQKAVPVKISEAEVRDIQGGR